MKNIFKSEKQFAVDKTAMPNIVDGLKDYFLQNGYDYKEEQEGESYLISVTKGGMFQKVLGLQSALKISLTPIDNHILFQAGIGFWEQQKAATIVNLFISWVVVTTQLWGIVQQAHLDDKALEIAERGVQEYKDLQNNTQYEYCPNCGRKVAKGTICPQCKTRVE